MSSKFVLAAALLAASMAACGGDDKGSSTSSSGGSSSGTSGGTTSSGGPEDAGASSSGTTPPAPKTIAAPKLTQLMKMTGSLHVMWDLPAKTTCDEIEGERKSETEAYKVVWSEPGEVDNKHDGTATKDTTYTYRLRCKIGSDYSDYSAEMSKNPLK